MLSNCQINNFKIVKQIGSGAHGLVFHVVDLFSNCHYAMKITLKSNMFQIPRDIKKTDVLLNQLYQAFHAPENKTKNLTLSNVALNDITNLTERQLDSVPYYKELHLHLKVHSHPNIVTIHQVMESNVAIFAIMDYYPNDLFSSIVDDGHFANDGLLIKKVLLQLCSALEFCSNLSVYHCDLKPENILLDKYDNIYLCDFGLATSSNILEPNVCIGSSYYMAPERIENQNEKGNDTNNNELTLYPTVKGDIWSLGILVINLTCIRNPWAKASKLEDKTFSHFLKDFKILQTILPISDELLQLLARILRINPYSRISYDEIKFEILSIKSFTKDGPLSKIDILKSTSISASSVIHHDSSIDSFYHKKSSLFLDEDMSSIMTPDDSEIEENENYLKSYSDEMRNRLIQYQMNFSNNQQACSNESLNY